MWIICMLLQSTCYCVEKNRNNLDNMLWSSEISYFRDILFHKCQAIYIHWIVIWTRDQSFRSVFYSEQWIFFYISFRSYKYIYIDFQLDENVTLRYFSIMRQWRDVEVRFGEIFVSCNQISGHRSEFLYVQELKMSMTGSEITWYDEMFYWDLMRYLCFVMRYHVIWWDKGTSIYWYLVF